MEKQPCRILAIDGGGIRGVIPTYWLNELEVRLKAPIGNFFDFIAGTSTGSIVASAVALGIPPHRILTFYRQEGLKVFPGRVRRMLSRMRRFFSQGISAPKYDPKGLKMALKMVFDDIELKEVDHNLIIVAHDTFRRNPLTLTSWDSEFFAVQIADAVRASCSAPVYFPAHYVKIGETNHSLIDGGVVANNPSALALAHAVEVQRNKHFWNGEFIVVSLGTGKASHPITYRQASNWGAAEWALPLISVLMDASEVPHYVSRMVLGDENYFRMQCYLDRKFEAMDNASPDNIDALIQTAYAYSRNGGSKKLDDIAERLKTLGKVTSGKVVSGKSPTQ